jgi:thiol-disulfide isomerase/thioredoxin
MNSNFPMLGGTPSMFQTITDIFFRYKFIILAIFLFIILGSYYYFQNVNTKTAFNANRDDGTSVPNSNKTAEMMLFYVDWCPHCKTAKPAWNDVKGEYENKTINGYKVIFTEINCTEETAEVESLMNKYNIEGFPTIKLLKDGQVIEYDAKPTKDTLTQFLNTVL